MCAMTLDDLYYLPIRVNINRKCINGIKFRLWNLILFAVKANIQMIFEMPIELVLHRVNPIRSVDSIGHMYVYVLCMSIVIR